MTRHQAQLPLSFSHTNSIFWCKLCSTHLHITLCIWNDLYAEWCTHSLNKSSTMTCCTFINRFRDHHSISLYARTPLAVADPPSNCYTCSPSQTQDSNLTWMKKTQGIRESSKSLLQHADDDQINDDINYFSVHKSILFILYVYQNFWGYLVICKPS